MKVVDGTEAENLDRWELRFVLSVRPLESALEQFRATTQVQLLLDAGPIGLDSLYAQAELLGNLTGPPALAEQAERLGV